MAIPDIEMRTYLALVGWVESNYQPGLWYPSYISDADVKRKWEDNDIPYVFTLSAYNFHINFILKKNKINWNKFRDEVISLRVAEMKSLGSGLRKVIA